MKDELEDLEKPDNWDFDNAVEHPPVRGRRAIVSVAFPRDDFQLVSGTAAKLGMKTSEFIRKAAIEKASTSAEILSIAWIGGTAGQFVFSGEFTQDTRVYSEMVIEEGQGEFVVTNR
ncbi:MAG: hypothetical protein IIB15_00425 [Chloroflexi bacterium]|nr:hypothetical protein [Chloroflexota bacterium]MCH8108568.1 hypothetical protein [Chloroflexota bacterium]